MPFVQIVSLAVNATFQAYVPLAHSASLDKDVLLRNCVRLVEAVFLTVPAISTENAGLWEHVFLEIGVHLKRASLLMNLPNLVHIAA